MSAVKIRSVGRCGRITLNRPDALNALTLPMIDAIDAALRDWAGDDAIAMVAIDAAGDRAFCAGGDLSEIYTAGRAGDFDFARRFWRREYRLNARLFEFPKPVVCFLRGYTLGGGVGIGCHGSHRIADETSRIALPEVGIGLVPDVGSSLMLARAPGRLGEYLGVTARRMAAADALHAGFADYFVPGAVWPDLLADLEHTADWTAVDAAAAPPDASALAALGTWINAGFAGATLADIVRALDAADSDPARDTLRRMAGHDALAMAASVELVRRARGANDMRAALELEYRFTSRAAEQGDFLEGIRALIIDKDKRPVWRHADPRTVPDLAVTRMLMPLGAQRWRFEEEDMA